MTNGLAAAALEPPLESLSRSRHNEALAKLLAQYDGEPLDVSIRQLVGPLPADDHTHSVYPYPARLVRHIPRLFLDATEVVPEGSMVIDPFCGSGTVMVEAQQTGRRSMGFDTNPIAVLAAAVKTTAVNESDIEALSVTTLRRAQRSRSAFHPPPYVDKWYDKDAYSALGRLARSIAALEVSPEADVLRLALALTARETSIADPRVPVPVRRTNLSHYRHTKGAVWARFDANVRQIQARVGRISQSAAKADVREQDSRTADAWAGSDDCHPATLLTSPPYGAAQKYVRSTSLEAGWLGLVPDDGPIGLERLSIGREHLSREDRAQTIQEIRDPALAHFLEIVEADNPVRASIYLNYFLEMSAAFETGLSRRPGIDTVILVCGTNMVAGRTLQTHQHLATAIASHGFDEILVLRDPIRGRILMTTRNGTGQPAQSEYVHVFRRKRRCYDYR